jgi:hypothetical protein
MLAELALLINHQYFQQHLPCWNDLAIQTRAKFLLSNILEIWPAIGEIPAPRTAAGTSPVRMVFLGQDLSVDSWRDVAEKTTEAIIQIVDNFDEIANTMTFYLSKDPFPIATRQLTNGWYMNVNLSADSIKRYCKTLITKSGLTLKDWQIEER